MPDSSDLADIVQERQFHSERALNSLGTLVERYSDWSARNDVMDTILNNEWEVIWPDKESTTSRPKVPNYILLAANDRAQTVAATNPSIICRPGNPNNSKDKASAEKRERMLGGWWYQNRVPFYTVRWALDAQTTGLSVVKVLPDFSKPASERVPLYKRLDPRYCYPDPVFTEGPFVDNMIVKYEEHLRSVEKRFGVGKGELNSLVPRSHARQKQSSKVDVIEWYDDEWVIVIAQGIAERNGKKAHEVLVMERHEMGKTPVAIGTRPTADGVYRSDFDSIIGILNVQNKFVTLQLDAGIAAVYPELLVNGVENPEEYGPAARIRVTDPERFLYQFVQPPALNFDSFQMIARLDQAARTGAALSPSRTGDPNESIISAAGISAAQGMSIELVRSVQRDTLALMLTAANELALRAEERWGGKGPKTVNGFLKGFPFQETYDPKKDIAGQYGNEVIYGFGAGMDRLNQHVMALQGIGQVWSQEQAMEMSPEVQDPQREIKRMAIEQLKQATFAGLIAQAQNREIDPLTVANIAKKLESDGVSLFDAVVEAGTPTAPLAEPGAPSPSSGPGAPGLAGAARGEQPQQPLPPLEELLA